MKRNQRQPKGIVKKPKTSHFHAVNDFKPSTSDFKDREGIALLDPGELPIPSCSHGPCLLFGNNHDRWFSCAVYRTRELCNYRVDVSKDDDEFEYKNVKPLKFNYGQGTLSEILSDSNSVIYWCSTCRSPVTIPHRDPVEEMSSEQRRLLSSATSILATKEANDGQAQYWFDSKTLDVVLTNLKSFDSVLSIGCPTIFEKIRAMENRKAFLLDYDHRFSNFFPPNEFAHYSMLNDHFYQSNGRKDLDNFLASARRLMIVVDPPFGVLITALQKTIEKVKARFLSKQPKGRVQCLFFLPLFLRKHLNELQMIDYKVTYSNHAQFKKPEKSIVRMFTDVDPEKFILPVDEGYRLCSRCRRYVSRENEHCEKCDSCTTVFGPTYVHCDRCNFCYKSTYTHCSQCKKCHLLDRCIRVY
ncbi:hypothetical protein M3Y98_00491300 [Aphelenchoides besseyi]|nr:hypothetical protein M3Y98_00491300 [Aphelenchoides besseyi]